MSSSTRYKRREKYVSIIVFAVCLWNKKIKSNCLICRSDALLMWKCRVCDVYVSLAHSVLRWLQMKWSDVSLNIWNCWLLKRDLQLYRRTVSNMNCNWQANAVCLHNLNFWLHHVLTANPAFKWVLVALSACMWACMCKLFQRQCGHLDKPLLYQPEQQIRLWALWII